MERSTIFDGKIHYFDWAIFNCDVNSPEGIRMILIFGDTMSFVVLGCIRLIPKISLSINDGIFNDNQQLSSHEPSVQIIKLGGAKTRPMDSAWFNNKSRNNRNTRSKHLLLKLTACWTTKFYLDSCETMGERQTEKGVHSSLRSKVGFPWNQVIPNLMIRHHCPNPEIGHTHTIH